MNPVNKFNDDTHKWVFQDQNVNMPRPMGPPPKPFIFKPAKSQKSKKDQKKDPHHPR